MKNIDLVWETLKNVMQKDLFDDVKEEIILTIEALKPIENPKPIKLEGK